MSEDLLTLQAEQAKLMGGKTTFKSLFSRGSKNEQIQKLEKSIPQQEGDIKHLGELNSMILVIFGSLELPAFRR